MRVLRSFFPAATRTTCGAGLLLLLTQCAGWKQEFVTVRPQQNAVELLTQAVAGCLHEPRYTAGMKSGEAFLQIVLPGFPVALEELTFNRVTGQGLLSSSAEIEKAYRLAKQVDGLLLLGQSPQADGSLLSEYYKGLARGGYAQLKPGKSPYSNALPPDWKLDELTYAGNNGRFFLTLLNPAKFVENPTWTVFEEHPTALDTLRANGRLVRVVVPQHRLSMELCAAKVERPWFELSYARSNAPGPKRAYVDEVIFARNVKLENFSESQLELAVSKKGKTRPKAPPVPTSRIEIASPVIIGYVYRII